MIRRALALAVLLSTHAAAQPRETLTLGIPQFPATFHPSIERMAAKSYIIGMAIRPVTVHGPDWKTQCMMCVELPTLENGLAVVQPGADGRPGVRVTYTWPEWWSWGDGRPVTADDVIFAYEAGREPLSGVGPAEFYRRLTKIDVEGPRRVTLHFDRLTFDFAQITDFVPMPAHIERAVWQADPRTWRTRTNYDTATTNPGLWNGPYRITAVAPGSSVTLERNPRWGGAAPHFTRITVRAIENTTALEAQLLAGQIDAIPGELGGIGLEQTLALEKRVRDRFAFHYQPGLVYEHIDLNLENPILADVRVRRALLHAADRRTITERLFESRQPVARTFVNPLDWIHDANAPDHPFDPARARALLDEAGWTLPVQGGGPDGIRRNAAGDRLSLDFMTTAGNRSREVVQQVLQSQWRAVGIEVRIRNEPPRVFFGETLNRRRYGGLALFAWISSPENVPRTTLHSDEITREERNWSGQNYTGFRNGEMDALLEELPYELDREKRLGMWKRVQAIYATELPVLPLFFRADPHVWPRWLAGVRPTGHLNPSTLWVEEWRVR
jgi:peptide/nickel transport system substrate-binding protein